MSLTPSPTTSSSVGRAPPRVNAPRFRRSGWWRWPSAARMRSSKLNWAPTPSPRWRCRRSSSIASSRAWSCWLIAGFAVSTCGSRHRRPGRICCGGPRTTPSHAGSRPSTDGSWLAELRRNNAKLDTEHVVVRVVDYDVDDGRNVEAGPFRLFTTLLDPTEVSATELAAAYAQRWEIESAFDELKTHQRGARTVLRSKSPDLVQQEIWGHLCCHYAIRTLMFAAAHEAASTRTGSPSSPLCGSVAARCHQRAIFPLRTRLTTAGPTPSSCSVDASTLPPSPIEPATDQTQDAPMARQTSTTRRLATTNRTTHHHHPSA